MPINVSHTGCIYSPHLYQSTQLTGKTGQLGNKIVRKPHGEIHHVSLHSESAHFGERNFSTRIQERSVEQRGYEYQKNSGVAPELNQGRSPRLLPKFEMNNNKCSSGERKDGAPPPLPPKPRMGPVGYGKLSIGSGITISGQWLTEENLRNLEKKYDISITPVRVCGKEIGYIFGQAPRDIGRIFLDCHGSGMDVEVFEKPVGVTLKFIAAKNRVLNLIGGERFLTKNVAKGRVLYKKTDEQIYESDSKKMLKNYSLSGFEPDSYNYYCDSKNCAKNVKKLKNKGTLINLMVLNPYADGVYLKDVIQGVNDTFRRMPELILSNCRGESENAKNTYPSYRLWGIGKARDSEFTPNSEKRMAGDWFDKISRMDKHGKR